MAQKKVVVIGSGPGGSSFAALMANAGHQVTLLEKNDFAGGKCTSAPHGDYVVDTGVHMFGRGPHGPFGQIARIVGEGPSWSTVNPPLVAYFSGKGPMETQSSMFHPVSALNIGKATMKGWIHQEIPATIKNVISKYGLKGALELVKKMANPRVPLYSELQDTTVEEFMTGIVASPELLRMMHAQCMITTVLPWDRASAGEFMYILSSTMRAKHLCYPRGGSSEIPLSFLRAFTREGGVLRLGCEVAGIESEDGKVKGVVTTSGERIPADFVVSNAGIKRTVQLAGPASFPGAYVSMVDGLKESEAFIAVKLFLDRKIKSLRAPCTFHIPDLPAAHMFDYLKDGGIPSDLFLFITIPSIWDPMLAPPGKDVLIVGVPAPSDLSRVEQCEGLLDLAERIAEKVMPEIRGHAVEKVRTHIAHTSHLTGRATGECIGLAQEVGQSGTRKPANAMPIQGLYLVGSDAGGRGIGTECAAESALYLYNQLK
jgi:phytoene dehydrogenase-like protein